MGDLTKHFSLWEFQSRDGARMPDPVRYKVLLTARMLEELRTALSMDVGRECPLDILSGYRSPAHNRAVGGVPNSYHLRGMAADMTCRYASPSRVQRIARSLQVAEAIGGVGSYPGFTHVDWGPRRSWGVVNRVAIGGAPRNV